ncbi:hypothetical protein FTX61_04100 [Nitriliruptoraceae bacterium ZYF776]|nr:hypothetical protein [Profundirhabdus halotolerans]
MLVARGGTARGGWTVMGAPLPRRTRDETRELLLLAGTLVADAVTDDDSPDQLARWLAYVRFDEVLRVTKQLQLYLLEHDVELPDGVARQRWLREHRAPSSPGTGAATATSRSRRRTRCSPRRTPSARSSPPACWPRNASPTRR